MVMQVGIGSRRNLEANGYNIRTFGFDANKVPLYAHKATNIAPRGAIQQRVTIANPKQLDEGESAMLSKKAANGFFPWPPGEECLQRNFADYTIKEHPLTGATSVEATEVYKGCKWCRAETESQWGPPVVPSSESESSFSSATPASTAATIQCEICGMTPKETAKSGKPRTKKQRKHSLALHMKQHTS